MKDITLFYYDNGKKAVTTYDLYEKLKFVKADQCDLLFIHTDLAGLGMPNTKLKRTEFFGAIYEVLLALKVKTLVFPAFTFSFANDEDFSVNDSTAKYMGALNEYVRKQPGVVRSLDPLMSVIAVGERAEEFYEVGKRCMNDGGIFDMLHQIPNVRFLFLGAKPTHCFTYAHYVEGVYNVPYRFEKWFEGFVTDRDGNTYKDSFSLLAGCKGIYPAAMVPFEKHMLKHDRFERISAGDGEIICFKESDAYQAMWEALDENIHGFLVRPFTEDDLVKEVKPRNGNRVVMVP